MNEKLKHGDKVTVADGTSPLVGHVGTIIGTLEGKNQVPSDVEKKAKNGDKYIRREWVETPYQRFVVQLDSEKDACVFNEEQLLAAGGEAITPAKPDAEVKASPKSSDEKLSTKKKKD